MKEFDLSKARTNDDLYTEYTDARKRAAAEIRARVKCTDYLKKSKHGSYICPVCGSGTGPKESGALKYYADTNTCACFANCAPPGKKAKLYDVIDLIMNANNCDYNEALEIGARAAGIQLPKYGDRIDAGWKEHKSIKSAENKAVESILSPTAEEIPTDDEKAVKTADFRAYYEACAARLEDPAAISYLSARGISAATARELNIGYDPQADPANAPGLIGNEYRPHPERRIIAPCSKSHYIARSINPDTPERWIKMNPAKDHGAGPVYLFNADAINGAAEVIFIAEGIFDALSFEEIGEAAIALNGKNNTALIETLLQDDPAENTLAFVIVPDNDENPTTEANTKESANNLKDSLQKMGYNAIVYNVAGQYHDANDALVKDKAGFISRAEAARQAVLKGKPKKELATIFKQWADGVELTKEQDNWLIENTDFTTSNGFRDFFKIHGLLTPEGIPTERGQAIIDAPAEDPAPDAGQEQPQTLPGLLTYSDAVNFFLSANHENIEIKSFPEFSATAKIRLHDSVVIAADTGAGKSSLAINFMNDLNGRYPCMYFNLEMDTIDVLQRLVSIQSGLELDRIEAYQKDEKTAAAVNATLTTITGRQPLQIIQGAYYLEKIEEIIHNSTFDRKEPTMVFIDHSLLVDLKKGSAGRYDRFTQVSEKLRYIALKYNIILFVLLQQNRTGKADENERPKNSSLKESGSWENDATQICFLWYDPADKRKKLLLTKNRHGVNGDFILNYWSKTQTYTERKDQTSAATIAPAVTKTSRRETQKQKLISAYERAVAATNGNVTLMAIAEAADVTTATVRGWIKEYGGCTIDGRTVDPAGIDTEVEYDGFIKLTPADEKPDFDDDTIETPKAGNRR